MFLPVKKLKDKAPRTGGNSDMSPPNRVRPNNKLMSMPQPEDYRDKKTKARRVKSPGILDQGQFD